MVAGTRVSRLLDAFRGMPPVDMHALEAVLLRVSELVCELPWIDELDINPLLAGPLGVIALDARIVIRPVPGQRTRYAHMAIHPYPTELVKVLSIPGGGEVVVRPIRPEDAEMEQAFVRGLSDTSRHFRFMNTVRELTPEMLVRFTQIDYDREMALVAVHRHDDRDEQVAVVRYVTNPDGETCEFAIVVADAWQCKGLGRRMLEMLIEVARARGLKLMTGDILATNQAMLNLCRALGFEILDNPEDPTTRRAILRLSKHAPRG
jgi:acetyltransferase